MSNLQEILEEGHRDIGEELLNEIKSVRENFAYRSGEVRVTETRIEEYIKEEYRIEVDVSIRDVSFNDCTEDAEDFSIEIRLRGDGKEVLYSGLSDELSDFRHDIEEACKAYGEKKEQ